MKLDKADAEIRGRIMLLKYKEVRSVGQFRQLFNIKMERPLPITDNAMAGQSEVSLPG